MDCTFVCFWNRVKTSKQRKWPVGITYMTTLPLASERHCSCAIRSNSGNFVLYNLREKVLNWLKPRPNGSPNSSQFQPCFELGPTWVSFAIHLARVGSNLKLQFLSNLSHACHRHPGSSWLELGVPFAKEPTRHDTEHDTTPNTTRNRHDTTRQDTDTTPNTTRHRHDTTGPILSPCWCICAMSKETSQNTHQYVSDTNLHELCDLLRAKDLPTNPSHGRFCQQPVTVAIDVRWSDRGRGEEGLVG